MEKTATDNLRRAIALHQAGQLPEAERIYRQILARFPDDADALHLLGVVAFQTGNLGEAENRIRAAIAEDPTVALYHANLGRVLKAAGRADADVYRDALNLEPDNPEVLSDLAGVLLERGQVDEAVDCCRQALNRNPELKEAAFNLGLALKAKGDGKGALDAFDTTLALAGDYADAHFERGRLLQDAGDWKAAIEAYSRAVTFDPAMVEAHCNLGNIHRQCLEPEKAIACYQAALKLDPENPEVRSNLGVALQESGDRIGAIENYHAALARNPGDAETHRNLAMALLQGGDFEEGWREFEWRWETAHFAHIRRAWPKPQWDGRALNGETVLVHHEQGYGDTIQFSRYLPRVAERGARVVVECPNALIGLVEQVSGVAAVVQPGNHAVEYDFHIPMMSLPGAFSMAFDNLPDQVPYLRVPEPEREHWSRRFGDGEEKRIGVVWEGNAAHARNQWRSPGLEAFLPVFDIPGCAFFSLQKDEAAEGLTAFGLTGRVRDLSADLTTFSDTAAVIANLDLVIGPDTAVAHLAGALATPIWLVLPHVPEWRWFEGRDDSPWYPTMRVLRQPRPGDWRAVIDEIARELDGISRENR